MSKESLNRNLLVGALLVAFAIAGSYTAQIGRGDPPPPCVVTCDCKNISAVYNYSVGAGALHLQKNLNMSFSPWTNARSSISTLGACIAGTPADASPQTVYISLTNSADLCSYSPQSRGQNVESVTPTTWSAPVTSTARAVCAPPPGP